MMATLTGAAVSLLSCSVNRPEGITRAESTLDSIYVHYGVDGTCLLRENFPSAPEYKATYLASEEQALPNPYSYLWPFSGTLSAAGAILESDKGFIKVIDGRILPGLYEYHDTSRQPYAYASYISSAPVSDRFYDDNVWLGIDFCDIYEATGDRKYLEQAENIWKFIESGTDDVLGGGIYWCEQKKTSKNTCSNAPGTVYALKLYKATGDTGYLEQAQALYDWTKDSLMDREDHLYFDNIGINGNIGKAKFAYNSGQMVQAGALLYEITGNEEYLTDARLTADSCLGYFFHEFTGDDGKTFRLINKGNVWFSAVMVRGFVELFRLTGDTDYINDIISSLDYAWNHARDEHGLFEEDFSGKAKNKRKWLLTQAAMAEMFARTADLKTK